MDGPSPASVAATVRLARRFGAAMLLGLGPALAQPPSVLEIEARIPLGQVSGRIDHLAIDLPRQRLFVAELGNDSVGVVDLAQRKLVHRLGGLSRPQGIGYVAATDTVYVANAADGSVRLFKGDGFAAAGRIDLGEDADNVRVDSAHNRVVVGHGSGALALIDPSGPRRSGDIKLKAHPEGFQLDTRSDRAYVNLPDVRSIAAVDLAGGKETAAWPTGKFGGNFPMALDADAGRIVVVFRSPPRLGVLTTADGKMVATVEACGDADDVFLDAKRQRAYVSCGEGFVDVIGTQGTFARLARVPTVPGARTALFVPELDRLFLAVRARAGEAAAIWVLRPSP